MALDDLSRRLRTLADPLRLRMLALLRESEAPVTDLVPALGVGQSTVSSHLGRLVEEGLVQSRREGRYLLYGPGAALDELTQVALSRFAETAEAEIDREALHETRRARQSDKAEGAQPGRNWESFARALLAILPPATRVADIGVGTGDMALLFARQCARVIGIDSDAEGLERLRARVATLRAPQSVECRLGSLEDPPLVPGEVDLVLLSQVLHLVDDPERGLTALSQALAPGTKLVLLDLLAHEEAWVLDRLHHRHLGFDPESLTALLEQTGFVDCRAEIAARDAKPPRFKTLLITATKGPA